jgi:tetratricopeptide (TPR) repeat protein
MDFRTSLAAMICLLAAFGAPAAAETGRDWMQAGMAQQSAGRYEEAVESFSKALAAKDMQPADRVRAVYDRGVASDSMGKTADAIADYSEAIRLDTKFAPALNNRANAYRRLAKSDEAKRDYWAALAIPGAGHEYSYYGLGQIAESQEDEELARGFYRRALKLNGKFALAAQSLKSLNAKAPPPARPAKSRGMPVGGVPALRPGIADRRMSEAENRAKAKDLEAKVAAAKREVMALKQAAQRRQQQKSQKPQKPQNPQTAGQGRPAAAVQLAAFRSRGEAEDAWKKILTRSGGLLTGRYPLIVEVVLPEKGRYFRLRLAADDKRAASTLCAALKAKGQDCMPVRE